MIIRLTEKLAKKVKETGLRSIPLEANPFADWTARLFTCGRTQYILFTNAATLYSVVIYGKGVTDGNALIHSMTDSLRDIMEKDGLGEVYYRHVAPQTARIIFGKTLSRSVNSSMNQLVFYAQVDLSSGEVSPYDVSFHLNETLMSYDKKYHKPKEMFCLAAQETANVIPIRR